MLVTYCKCLKIYLSSFLSQKYLNSLTFFVKDLSSLKYSSVRKRDWQVNDYTCNEFREIQSDSENAINSRVKYVNCFQYLKSWYSTVRISIPFNHFNVGQARPAATSSLRPYSREICTSIAYGLLFIAWAIRSRLLGAIAPDLVCILLARLNQSD